jgi:hypothetical protein
MLRMAPVTIQRAAYPPAREPSRTKIRAGTPCQRPAAKGKKRCKLHGGADGIGAPKGEQNGAYKHGLRTY